MERRFQLNYNLVEYYLGSGITQVTSEKLFAGISLVLHQRNHNTAAAMDMAKIAIFGQK
jgi:hypothetical protein